MVKLFVILSSSRQPKWALARFLYPFLTCRHGVPTIRLPVFYSWALCSREMCTLLSLLIHFLPEHLCRWWKLLPRVVSQRTIAGQKCSSRKHYSSLECMKNGNWSKSYDVLQTCRNQFAMDINRRHNGSEWVKHCIHAIHYPFLVSEHCVPMVHVSFFICGFCVPMIHVSFFICGFCVRMIRVSFSICGFCVPTIHVSFSICGFCVRMIYVPICYLQNSVSTIHVLVYNL